VTFTPPEGIRREKEGERGRRREKEEEGRIRREKEREAGLDELGDWAKGKLPGK
jgi:hypothetical protein